MVKVVNEYSIEQIEKLRIHELRDYAKTIGVSSPTTMNKDALIERIKEIFAKKNMGVENEKVLDFFELLKSENSSVLNKLLDLEAKSDRREARESKSRGADYTKIDTTGFALSIGQNEAPYSTDGEVCEGFLDIHPEGYGIVRKSGYIPSDLDIYVTEALVKKKNLKKGSYIKGKAKTIVASKPKIMYEVTYDEIVAGKVSTSFDNIPYNPIGEKLRLTKNKFDVCKGQRVYTSSMELEEVLSIAGELANENGCRVKLVNFKALPEASYIVNPRVDIINIPFNKSEIEALNTIDLVVERVKRELELGMSNVLILYGFSDMLRAFSVAFSSGVYEFGILGKVNAKAVGKIKNALYTAKSVNKNKYVSVLCADKNGIPGDMKEILEYELLPLFNSVV